MKIYPSNADISKLLTFRDNKKRIKYLVGKEKDFINKDKFIDYLKKNNIKIGSNIDTMYIRHYSIKPKKKQIICNISNNECYAFSKKERGAMKVFVLERG